MKKILILTVSFYTPAMYAQSLPDDSSSKKYLGRRTFDSVILKSTVDSVYPEKTYSVNDEISDALYILHLKAVSGKDGAHETEIQYIVRKTVNNN